MVSWLLIWYGRFKMLPFIVDIITNTQDTTNRLTFFFSKKRFVEFSRGRMKCSGGLFSLMVGLLLRNVLTL